MKRITIFLISLLTVFSSLLISPTSAANPAFHTDVATSLGETTATLNGDLTDMGGNGYILCNFEYGTTISYGSTTIADNKTGTGAFASNMTGLSSGVLYHYRAKIVYGSTTAYGADETFSTTSSGGLASPDILDIVSVQVYKDYKVPGDRMFVIVYKLIFSPDVDPEQDIQDYFVIKIKSSGIVKAQSRPLMWGYRVLGIYQNPITPIDWQSASCTVTLEGTQSKYGVIPPSTVYTLSSGDWIGSDKNDLISYVLSTAESIGLYYSVALTSYTSLGKKLSDTSVLLSNTWISGSELFINGISGLKMFCPSLFVVTVTTILKPVDDPHPQTMRTFTSIDARWGAGAEAKLNDLGTTMGGGIAGKDIYLLFWLALMLLAAASFAGASPSLGGAVAAIVGVSGAYMGADLWIILGISGMLLSFFVVFDYFKNT